MGRHSLGSKHGVTDPVWGENVSELSISSTVMSHYTDVTQPVNRVSDAALHQHHNELSTKVQQINISV